MNRLRKMKAIILVAVMVFAATLSTSCNSEEDLLPLVGTWLQSSSSTEEFTNNVSDGITTDTFDADNVFKITFNTDGTFSDFSSYSYTDNGDVIVETSSDAGTYSVIGNLLSVTYDGETDTETAEFTLSKTRLGIVHVEEFTENGDQKRLVTIATYDRQPQSK
ncbi:lipocalin family protein [Flagellimonas sp. HMM57]|uniref:lipocalin family protein n=1 Tax=unclassified Flagellimonas TaxID=2644544 RepID=UPI0013D1A489|nr:MULTISPECIES: lipocalin family protein [unclassified Flagellimonas]UII76428.1 lipocalin family protein [Flagellimonas sp. HMM57]